MKSIIGILLTIFLSGCGSDSIQPSPTSGSGGGKPSDPAKPLTKMSWDQLPCQKEGSCANPILNVKLENLIFHLEAEFEAWSSEKKGDEEATFICGSQFFNFWQNSFPGDRLGSTTEKMELAELAVSVLDLGTCCLKNDLQKNLKTYFENTKEYSDVTHKS